MQWGSSPRSSCHSVSFWAEQVLLTAEAELIAEMRRPGPFSQQAWAHETCERVSVALHAIVRLADHSMQRYAHPPQQRDPAGACEAADSEPKAGERDVHAARLEQAAYVRLGEQSLLRGMKRAALLRLMEQDEAWDNGDEWGSEGPCSEEEGLSAGGNESGGESDESESDESEGESEEALAPGVGQGGGEAAHQVGAGSQLACEVHGSLHQPADEDPSPEKRARKKPKL